jgi:hypothetical protein
MLKPEQLTTLKAAILAETDVTFAEFRSQGATGAMAEWFNVAAAPAHVVWATNAPVNGIQDAIDYSAYTPNGAVDGTVVVTNRLLAAQTQQINLQLMLQGRDSLNASPNRVRAALLDATTNIPTGANGALQSAAGVDGARVMNALTRLATRGEKLFTTAPVLTGTVSANKLVFEGGITNTDVVLALEA